MRVLDLWSHETTSIQRFEKSGARHHKKSFIFFRQIRLKYTFLPQKLWLSKTKGMAIVKIKLNVPIIVNGNIV